MSDRTYTRKEISILVTKLVAEGTMVYEDDNNLAAVMDYVGYAWKDTPVTDANAAMLMTHMWDHELIDFRGDFEDDPEAVAERFVALGKDIQ